jgi:hypothetical protein
VHNGTICQYGICIHEFLSKMHVSKLVFHILNKISMLIKFLIYTRYNHFYKSINRILDYALGLGPTIMQHLGYNGITISYLKINLDYEYFLNENIWIICLWKLFAILISVWLRINLTNMNKSIKLKLIYLVFIFIHVTQFMVATLNSDLIKNIYFHFFVILALK